MVRVGYLYLGVCHNTMFCIFDEIVFMNAVVKEGCKMKGIFILLFIGTQLFFGPKSYSQGSSKCYPVCAIMGQYDGTISVAKLCKGKGLEIIYPNCDRKGNDVIIKRYTIDILRNSELIYTKIYKGNNPGFDQRTTELFQELRNGDVINVSSIYVSVEKVTRNMSSLRLSISGRY